MASIFPLHCFGRKTGGQAIRSPCGFMPPHGAGFDPYMHGTDRSAGAAQSLNGLNGFGSIGWGGSGAPPSCITAKRFVTIIFISPFC
jgi:hypothetical protein